MYVTVTRQTKTRRVCSTIDCRSTFFTEITNCVHFLLRIKAGGGAGAGNLKPALTSYTPLLQTPQSVQKKSAPPTNFNSKLGGVMQQASRTWYPTSGASPDQYSSVSKPLLPLQLPECSQTLLLLQAESKMHS